MIKGLRTGDPGMLVLGLSAENIKRLTTGGDEGLGQPILFSLSEVGLPPLPVVLFAAETDDQLREIAITYGLLGAPDERP